MLSSPASTVAPHIFRQTFGGASTFAAKHFKAFALGGKPVPPPTVPTVAWSVTDKYRSPLFGYFHAGNAHIRFRHAGHIPAGCHKQGREPVGEVSLNTNASALHGAYRGWLPVLCNVAGVVPSTPSPLLCNGGLAVTFCRARWWTKARFFIAGIIAFDKPEFGFYRTVWSI